MSFPCGLPGARGSALCSLHLRETGASYLRDGYRTFRRNRLHFSAAHSAAYENGVPQNQGVGSGWPWIWFGVYVCSDLYLLMPVFHAPLALHSTYNAAWKRDKGRSQSRLPHFFSHLNYIQTFKFPVSRKEPWMPRRIHNARQGVTLPGICT